MEGGKDFSFELGTEGDPGCCSGRKSSWAHCLLASRHPASVAPTGLRWERIGGERGSRQIEECKNDLFTFHP